MAIFLLAMGTIALLGLSQVDHKEDSGAKIVTEKAVERCYKSGHEKKCELRYK